MRHLRVGLAQINCTVGDLEGNGARIIAHLDKSRAKGVDIVCFPEMSITGYPPEDLLLKPRFIADNIAVLDNISKHTNGLVAIVGFVDKKDDIYNAAAVLCDQKLVAVVHKNILPNYGVFDENRYFASGKKSHVFVVRGVRVGVNICEDIWSPHGPITVQTIAGMAELIVNINASPYYLGKREERARMLAGKSQDNSVVIAYTNMVGGQDELVFDGGSMIYDQNGDLAAMGGLFSEDFVISDVDFDDVFRNRIKDPRRRKIIAHHGEYAKLLETIVISENGQTKKPETKQDLKADPYFIRCHKEADKSERCAEVYEALTLGVRDYFKKNGFSKAVMGMSGGIDSALCAVIASDALGPENVVGVFMPSGITSEESREDAKATIANIGSTFYEIPISELVTKYQETTSPVFSGRKPDKTEENIQARIRGNLLMAISNKFGWIVLTTGNKSEMSVGYATLYGDLAGGFAVIKDIYKTMVYGLCEHVNQKAGKELIPARVLTKAPTAELKPGQLDQDTLPPYDVLDKVLAYYIEEDFTASEIVQKGFDKKLVSDIAGMVDKSEYKRRQSPMGIKVSKKAFGRDRRLPVSNRYWPH